MKNLSMLFICIFALAVAGCSQLREELGLNRHSPDEFTVVKRAPLTLPPEYSLRPPKDGYTGVDSAAETEARAVIFGDAASTQTQPTTANQLFLSQAGADQANPEIRSMIANENGYIQVKNPSTVEKILNIGADSQAASTIDARKEAERLRENKAAGQPVTAGDVPVIEKKQSTIEKIF